MSNWRQWGQIGASTAVLGKRTVQASLQAYYSGRSNNSDYLNNVEGASISPIAGLMPASKGADKTNSKVCGASYLIQEGTCYDGVHVTFPQSYGSTNPRVWLLAGGVTSDSSLTGQLTISKQVSNLTPDGFDPILKISELSGTTTSESQNFSPYSTYGASASLSLSALSINNSYTPHFTVKLGAGTEIQYCGVQVTFNGAIVWSQMYSGNPGEVFTESSPITSSSIATGQTVEVAVTYGNGTVSATTFTYVSGTAPAENTLTPAGASGVRWVAYPAIS